MTKQKTKIDNQFKVREVTLTFRLDRPLYSPMEVESIIRLLTTAGSLGSVKIEINTTKKDSRQ